MNIDLRRSSTRPLKIVMIPSVSGGIGHVSRTATLARALRRLDPSVEVEYVLDADRLRPFNIDATLQMGYRPRLMPPRTRDSRDAIVRACLGDADVIVDDTARYLIPLRRIVPDAAWVSIPMHPIHDELFMDWPFLAQADLVIWAYAPLVGIPAEMDIVADRVVSTGPFLDLDDVPDKAAARAMLGYRAGQHSVVYAPRGFPFGREFGHRVLAAVYGAIQMLRRLTQMDIVLDLVAVPDRAELQGIPDVPVVLPDWVRVHSILPQAQALLHMQAASILVAEGTSTMHEGAGLRTPLVLLPGPIQETLLLARKLAAEDAAQALIGEALTADRVADAFAVVLGGDAVRDRMTERARALVTTGGGVDAAARAVLDLAIRRAAASEPLYPASVLAVDG